MRVLIVDDSEIVREMTSDALRDAGMEVFSISSPLGMVSAIIQHSPDIVLVDLEMPALSGEKAVEILARSRVRTTSKVLLYSSKAAKELEAAAKRCNADGFIRKTDNLDALVSLLQGMGNNGDKRA